MPAPAKHCGLYPRIATHTAPHSITLPLYPAAHYRLPTGFGEVLDLRRTVIAAAQLPTLGPSVGGDVYFRNFFLSVPGSPPRMRERLEEQEQTK